MPPGNPRGDPGAGKHRLWRDDLIGERRIDAPEVSFVERCDAIDFDLRCGVQYQRVVGRPAQDARRSEMGDHVRIVRRRERHDFAGGEDVSLDQAPGIDR